MNSVSSELSWTHYRHLLKVENESARLCFGGFVPSDSEHIKLEYKRLLIIVNPLSKNKKNT